MFRKPIHSLAILNFLDRFAYYGIRANLILFLIGNLSLHLDAAYDFAAAIFVLFYIFPIIGGWLSDQKISPYSSVLIGLSFKLIGHVGLIFLASDLLYFTALIVCLILGNLFYRSPMIILIKNLSEQAKLKSDIGYNLLFIAYQLGALTGIALTAYLAQSYGFEFAFMAMAAAVALEMLLLLSLRIAPLAQAICFKTPSLIALAAFSLSMLFLLQPHLLDYFVPTALITLLFYLTHLYRSFTQLNKRRTKMLFFFMGILWIHLIFYAQINLSFLVYLQNSVNREFFSFLVPAPWLQAFSAFFMIFFTLFFIKRLKKTGRSLFYGAYMKGITAAFLAYSILLIGLKIGKGEDLFLFFLLMSIFLAYAQATLYPIALSSITAIAPKAHRGFFVGLWGFGAAFSYYAAGELAKFSLSSHPFSSDEGSSFLSIGQKVSLNASAFEELMTILSVSMGLILLVMILFQKQMKRFEFESSFKK